MSKKDSKIEINELGQLDELSKTLKQCQTTLNSLSKQVSVSDEVKRQSRQRDEQKELEQARSKFVFDLQAKANLLDTFFEVSQIDETIPEKVSGWNYDEISFCCEKLGRDKFLDKVRSLTIASRNELEDFLPAVEQSKAKR